MDKGEETRWLGIGRRQLAQTLLAGLLCTAIWEKVLDPVLGVVGRFTLTVTTLGIKSLVNEVYLDVAKGLHEESGVALLAVWLLLMPYVPLVVVNWLRGPAKPLRGDAPIGRWAMSFALFMVFISAVLMARLVYVNGAILHFRQSMEVAAPFLSDAEVKVLRSDFASIRTREDFSSVMARIRATIVKNGRSQPKFSIW